MTDKEHRQLFIAMQAEQMKAFQALLLEFETRQQQMSQIVRRAKSKEARAIANDCEQLVNAVADAVKRVGLVWLAEGEGPQCGTM